MKGRYIVGGLGVYALGVWAGVTLLGTQNSSKKETVRTCGQAFEHLAEDYDNRIGRSEWLSGILKMRKRLLQESKGSVLEVAAGTGRNLEYYPADVFVTMVDSSPAMLDVAREKAKKAQVHSTCWVGDAQSLPFEDNVFDTVVDTFGLCSLPDPDKALQEMTRVCKPDGCVRLLEHGRSKSFQFINNYLDKRASQHVHDWGCEWNRDIEAIVSRCTGLEKESERSHHFGTTYELVLRKVASK